MIVCLMRLFSHIYLNFLVWIQRRHSFHLLCLQLNLLQMLIHFLHRHRQLLLLLFRENQCSRGCLLHLHRRLFHKCLKILVDFRWQTYRSLRIFTFPSSSYIIWRFIKCSCILGTPNLQFVITFFQLDCLHISGVIECSKYTICMQCTTNKFSWISGDVYNQHV